MTLIHSKGSAKPWVLLGSGSLLLLSTLLAAAPGQAQPWGRPAYGPPPLPPPAAPYGDPRPARPSEVGGPPWGRAVPGAQTVYDHDPTDWSLSEAQMSQRCNLGRLVGGLIGGGVGYATSRQDGRSWAIPLGALLGSQMGCNVGAGRGPVPW